MLLFHCRTDAVDAYQRQRHAYASNILMIRAMAVLEQALAPRAAAAAGFPLPMLIF